MAELNIRITLADTEHPILKLYYSDEEEITLVGTLLPLCLDVDQDTKDLQNCLLLEFESFVEGESREALEEMIRPFPFIMIKQIESAE